MRNDVTMSHFTPAFQKKKKKILIPESGEAIFTPIVLQEAEQAKWPSQAKPFKWFYRLGLFLK